MTLKVKAQGRSDGLPEISVRSVFAALFRHKRRRHRLPAAADGEPHAGAKNVGARADDDWLRRDRSLLQKG